MQTELTPRMLEVLDVIERRKDEREGKGPTLKQIADDLGLSRSRVWQLTVIIERRRRLQETQQKDWHVHRWRARHLQRAEDAAIASVASGPDHIMVANRRAIRDAVQGVCLILGIPFVPPPRSAFRVFDADRERRRLRHEAWVAAEIERERQRDEQRRARRKAEREARRRWEKAHRRSALKAKRAPKIAAEYARRAAAAIEDEMQRVKAEREARHLAWLASDAVRALDQEMRRRVRHED